MLRTPLLTGALKRSIARVVAMPQWPWQAQPARKRSRTPSESEAGEALHFEDSDFYAHPSAGPNQVQVTDESVNDNMGGGGKGDGGQGETSNQFVQKGDRKIVRNPNFKMITSAARRLGTGATGLSAVQGHSYGSRAIDCCLPRRVDGRSFSRSVFAPEFR